MKTSVGDIYKEVVENATDGIAIVSDGKFVFVNKAMAEIFGYVSVDEVRRLSLMEFIAPQNQPFLPSNERSRTVSEEPLIAYEIKGVRADGKEIELEVNATVIDWEGVPSFLIFFRDVTRRKNLERQHTVWLWEEEILSSVDRQLLQLTATRDIFNTVTVAARNLVHSDFAGVFRVIHRKNLCVWRVKRGSVLPPFTQANEPTFTPECELPAADHRIYTATPKEASEDIRRCPFVAEELLKQAALFPIVVSDEVNAVLAIGYRSTTTLTQRHIQLLQSLVKKGAIAIDHVRLYENLLRHERELEYLSGQRSKAQEEERARIARELHDGLGQILTAIKFNAELMEDSTQLTEEDRSRLADIKSLLDTAMKEVRQISHNLMPSVLEDFGLMPALQLLTDQFSRSQGVGVKLFSQGIEQRLESSLEIGLYRIVQEALNNIAKHADASEVSIQVLKQQELVRVVIEDDGKGFDLHGITKSLGQESGMGLLSMRERARSMYGTLTIDSYPDSGTTIIVEIPMGKQEHADVKN